MLVPKYTAQAPKGTGVSGQPMSFKIPGGALSQAAVATGRAYDSLSDQAGQWGRKAYAMHRDIMVADAVGQGVSEIDAASTEAQRISIADPKYANAGGGPLLAFFDERTNAILDRVGSTSRDPLTNRQIRTRLAGHVADRRRILGNYYAGRLVNESKARLAKKHGEDVISLANLIPHDWDGVVDTLPIAARVRIDAIGWEQSAAAETGFQTFTEAENTLSAMWGEIAQHSVSVRNISATTVAQTDDLLALVEDTNNFRGLDLADRDRWIKELTAKSQQLISAEISAETRARAANNAARTERQNKRHTVFVNQIIKAWENGGEGMPTYLDISAVSALDGGLGLPKGSVATLNAMIDKTGPTDSDPTFITEIHEAVYELMDQELDINSRRVAVNEVIDRAARQIGRGHESRITDEAYITFSKWARSTVEGTIDHPEQNRYRSIVSQHAAPRDPITGLLFVDPTDVYKEIDAVGFYDLQIARGVPPPEAAQLALQRVGVRSDATAGEPIGTAIGAPRAPLYPIGIPDSFWTKVVYEPQTASQVEQGVPPTVLELSRREEFPSRTSEWTSRHVAAARKWLSEVQDTEVLGATEGLRLDRYVRLQEDLSAILAYRIAADAAAERRKATDGQ